jgi:hypothetical protein
LGIEATRQRKNVQEVFWAFTAERSKAVAEIRIHDGGSEKK